jgi:hypothetical protein
MCDNCDWRAAISVVQEINEEAEWVPERGEDFATSVTEKANDIEETVTENEHVTEGQMTALENMLDGLKKWTRR